MNTIEISVIIPIYNAENYLKNCLDHLIKIQEQNIEFLLINDGSSDNSDRICEYFVDKDIRIRYINKKNEGVSKTRNLGIKLSKGKYIAFLDADDYVDSSIYTKMYKKIVDTNADICICGIKRETKEGFLLRESIPKKFKEKYRYFTDDDIFGYPVNKLYKKEIIEKNSLFFNENISMSEDLLFNYEYFSYINKIEILEEALYHYILHTNGASNNKYRYTDRFLVIEAVEKILRLRSDKKNYQKSLQNLYNSSFIKVNYSILEDLKLGKDEYFKIFKDEVNKFEAKHRNSFSMNNKYNILKRKLRLQFYFLKPYILKILRR